MEGSETLFEPIEEALSKVFLPALFGGPPPSRKLTALPVRFGGLGVPNLTTLGSTHFATSSKMTTALVDSLIANTDLEAATHHAESIQALKDHKKQQEKSLWA